MEKNDEKIEKSNRRLIKLLNDAADLVDRQAYLEENRKSQLSERPKKIDLKKPEKSGMITAIILNTLALILLIGSIVLFSSMQKNFAERNMIIGIIDNYGEAYEAWLDSWPSKSILSDNLSELEDGWAEVEKDFAEKGVSVSWEKALEFASGLYCSQEHFTSNLREYLSYDVLKGVGNTLAWKMMLLIVNAIAFLILLINGLKRIGFIKEYIDSYKVYKKNKIYNETELLRLVEEFEQRDLESKKEYEQSRNEAKEKLEEILYKISEITSIPYFRIEKEDYRRLAEYVKDGMSLEEALEEEREANARKLNRLMEEERERRQIVSKCRRCKDFNTCTAKYRRDCPGRDRY